MAIDNSTSLGVINNPDSTTVTGIEFVKNGFNLDGKRSLLGLPNFVQSIIQPPSGPGISYSDTCFGTPTQFSSGPICDPLKDKYAWDFGDGTTSTQQQPTHLYKAPGSYTVKLRLTNNCKDTTMSASLVIKPTPIAKLGPDKTVCARSVELDAGNTVPGQFLYLWIQNDSVITGARGPKLSVTRSGTYTVLIANTDGDCVVGDTIRVNLTLPKPISLGADTVLCSGQRLNLEVKNQTAGATYLWSNNTTASTLTVSQPGTYIVTVTDRSQGVCTNADTIVVRGGNKPNFTARIQDASGCLTTDGSITIENISPQAGYRFIWSTNGQTIPTSVTSQLDGLKVGTYGLKMAGFDRTIQITCTLDTTFVINAKNPDLQVALANLANANCLAPNTGSIALRIVKGVPTTYIWRNAAGAQVPGGQTLSGVPAGTYSVEVSDATGCKFSLSNLVVRLNPSKFVELGPDSTRCAGDPITLDAGNQGDSYRWSTGATTRTINITQTGTYTVTVSDSRTRCESSDTVRLTINPKPTIVVGPTQIVCANAAPLVLNATPAGGSWNGNGVTPEGIFRPSQLLTGPITLTYSVNQRGCVAQANKTLTVQPIPDVSLGPDRSYCTNSPQTLSIPELPGATYRWSTGETTTSIIPKRTGTYSVSVALGSCRDTDTVRIEVLPSPILSVKAEVPLCAVDRDTVTLDAGGLPGYRYNWNPIGATTRRIRVEQTGVYTVRVTNAEGCTEERPVTVFDECEPRIVVPDIFTPNGDGLNDRLDVYVAHITDYELRIYNRWGEMLFRTSDVNEKWDGTYKGVRYPTQSYAWVVAYKSTYFPERPTAYKRGAVMLVR
ncbi:MAG: gliding motility-associated C-terminal domain-containing protein [Cytophagaceae bacterium]|nr:gliding motility-associated C-terminal domain-containing protein [Cytophagaceae bacterium]